MKNQSCWNQKLGRPECPYLIRFVLDFYIFSVRVHYWLKSDDERHFHDHSWNFLSIILGGSYVDVSPDGEDKVEFGSIRYRKATHKHYVKVGKDRCLSLLICGFPIRKWGFWVNGRERLMRPLRYFSRYGHPQC